MAETWPAQLQQYWDEDNFSFKYGSTTLKSDMGQGPAKVRRISTRPVNMLTVSILVTAAQFVDYFDPFYRITLNAGTTAFTFLHPIRQENRDFKIIGEPALVSIGGGNFRVTFDVEEQPV